MMITSVEHPRANKTDAGNGSKAICRVSNVSRSPSPDPRRYAKRMETGTILDSSGKPLESTASRKRRKLRGLFIWCGTAIGAIALLVGNLDNIFATTASWIPKDAKTRPGFPAVFEGDDGKKLDLTISFPLIRASDKCLYEDYEGTVHISSITLDSVKMGYGLTPVGFGGDLKEQYPIGISATPQLKDKTFIYSDPIFELVVRNDGNQAVVLSDMGVRINLRRMKPMKGPYDAGGTRIQFDEVTINTSDMGFEDTKFARLDPVTLPPGAVHGIRLKLENWPNQLLHVVQLLVRIDGHVAASPEIYIHY